MIIYSTSFKLRLFGSRRLCSDGPAFGLQDLRPEATQAAAAGDVHRALGMLRRAGLPAEAAALAAARLLPGNPALQVRPGRGACMAPCQYALSPNRSQPFCACAQKFSS